MAGPTDPGGLVAPQYTDVGNCLTYPDPSNHAISSTDSDDTTLINAKKERITITVGGTIFEFPYEMNLFTLIFC